MASDSRPHSPTSGTTSATADTGAWASAVVLALVGGLFVWKYGIRIVSVPVSLGAAILYAALYLTTLARVGHGWGAQRERISAVALVGLAVCVAFAAPEENGLARAPAIDEWLSALTSGVYPYSQPSIPSGLPVLFLLAAPFWAAGALWVIPPLGIALLLWTAFERVMPERRSLVLVAVAGFVPAWYEIQLHSELIANGMVAILALLAADALRRRGGAAALGLAAVVGGLALSTRLSVALAFTVYGAWALRRQPLWALAWGALSLGVWALTVAPFALWEPEAFRAGGPFSSQARYLPTSVSLLGLGVALASGWTANSMRIVLRRAGGLLFVLTTFAFAQGLYEDGAATFWSGHFDVTYFILGAPFLILGLPGWKEAEESDGRSARRPGRSGG